MRPAIVMGGAPSLPDEIPEVEGAVYISANEHGARLRKVDWVVCGDKHHQTTKELMRDRCRQYTDAPIVTQHLVEDTVRIHNFDSFLMRPNSGNQAVLWAWLLGYTPIVLCGFGLYQGGVYWHSQEARSSGTTKSVQAQLTNYRNLHFSLLPHTIRSMGGPLRKITGLMREEDWNPPEPPVSHKRAAYWRQLWGWYECIAEHDLAKVGGSKLEKGRAYYLSHHESRGGIKGNFLRPLSLDETTGLVRPSYFDHIKEYEHGDHPSA